MASGRSWLSGDVLVGDHQQVPRRDRPDVEEGAHQLVTVEEAGRRLPLHDAAEDAIGLHRIDYIARMPSRLRAITMRWISLVPSPISVSFASRR